MTVVTNTLSTAYRDVELPPQRADLRVLFVEDNPGDARLIAMELQGAGGFRVSHVETLRHALDLIATEPFDVVLLDLSLPDALGTGGFEAIRVAAPSIPVVVLTGHDYEATALSMMHAGAQDYLVKGGLAGSVVRSLRYAIERHDLLQALATARRHESEQKDRFLAHVSHELRSPLAVSYLYTTNLLDGVVGDLTPEQREHLAVAVDALRAQMQLIDELLAAVRSDASLISIEKSTFALRDLIADTLRGFGSRQESISVEARAEDGLPPVYADVTRIKQVLTNLVDNAFKFSPPGSTIRVDALAAPGEPGWVRVDVTDQGPGIPEKARERIFDCLFRDDSAGEGQKGLGLGLYLSKLLVQRHGGRIWVEAAMDGGSRFSFTLPFASSKAADRKVQA